MSIIEAIKDRADIVDVATRFMSLRRFGQRYKGLCPFHTERTPSFTIYSESGRYKCFGCGVFGSVIDLWANFNGVDTRTAVWQMAEEFGISHIETSETRDMRNMWGVQRFLQKREEEHKQLLVSWRNALEDFIRGLKTIEEMEPYGCLYHDISRIELWIHNLDGTEEAGELLDLCECIPKRLLTIYHNNFD